MGWKVLSKGCIKIAVSAYSTGETIPIFVVSPVVTMEIGVTSEPVPAVVGIKISGRRAVVTWFYAVHLLQTLDLFRVGE